MRSVVLASCDGERFIGEQLDSILPQLAAEDEVVVSDDASTDRTLEVVAQRRDSRIRILAHENRVGYVGNFQRAVESSRGEFVFFSDQDDIWLPGKVSALDEALKSKLCVASDATVVDTSLRILHPSFFELRGARRFSHLAIYLKPCIVGATLACHRSYLERSLPFPAGVPHDFWLALNAAYDGVLGVVPRPLILYRRHAHSLSVSATSRKRPLHTIATERLRLMIAMLQHRLIHRPRYGY
jgi:glycosyltransferase involved in cell wall biosynthesis